MCDINLLKFLFWKKSMCLINTFCHNRILNFVAFDMIMPTRLKSCYNTPILILIILISLGFLNVAEGQNDFRKLNPVDLSYKRVLKESKNQQLPVLVIAFSGENPTTSVLFFEPSPELDFINTYSIAYQIDWLRKSSHPVFRNASVTGNPSYMMLSSDGTVLSRSTSIENLKELKEFVENGNFLFKTHSDLMVKYASDKKNPETLKELINFYLHIKNENLAGTVIGQLLDNQKKSINEADTRYLFSVARQCICDYVLWEFLKEKEEEILSFATLDEYLLVKQKYILQDLVDAQLLDPPTVWERFEEELGIKADSLFRLFAIEYFRIVEPNKEILMNEIYDFLYYYPETPWEKQDSFYKMAIDLTSQKEDFQILLDLISYQVYRNRNYRNLDYRAVILYKLGYTDRALGLMQDVQAEALKAGILYKSMLYELSDQN